MMAMTSVFRAVAVFPLLNSGSSDIILFSQLALGQVALLDFTAQRGGCTGTQVWTFIRWGPP